MSMIGIQQTKVVMAIIEIQSSQDPSETKEISFYGMFYYFSEYPNICIYEKAVTF